MASFPILRDIGVIIVGATVALFALRPLRIPPILAYMVAGLVLGPFTGLLRVSEPVEVLAELGIALLLFVVGLELSIGKIRDVGRPAVIGGLAQVAATFVLGGGLALALGFDATTAAFLGLATAFSSTVVVVKLLDRAGELDALHGRIAIGILLVQDVVVAVVLTLVSGLGAAGGGGVPALARGLASALLGIVVLAAVAGLAVRWLLPALFDWLAESTEALFIGSLTWAFAFIIAAEMLHVSVELGAFVAGVALAQLPYNDELRRRVHPLVDFFLAVFFVGLGASMDPGAAAAHLPAAVGLSLFVLVVKPLLIAVLLGWLGHAARTNVLAGVTLGQVSEFAFILTGLAVGAGVLGQDALSVVGLMGLITIGISAVLVPRAPGIYQALRRRGLLRALPGSDAEAPPAPARAGHVVVVGMNTLGRLLVQELAARGERVLAIDTDPDKLRGLPAETLFGSADSPAVLEEADVPRAKLVISALQIEDVNSLLAYRCHELGVPVSVHAFDPSQTHELLEIGAEHVIVSKHDGIRQMAQHFRRLGVVR